MIQDLLQQFGLTTNESEIFTCVFTYKKINAARIAKLTNINRVTVYTVLRELVKKKLVIEDLGSGMTHYFSPVSSDRFQSLIQQEEKILEEKKKIAEKITHELTILPSSKEFSIPKIRYIDELRLKDFLLNESEKWLKNSEKKDKIWWGFQDASLLDEYPEWPKYFFDRYKGKTSLKILTNKKPIEIELKKEYEDRQLIKYIEDEEFTATHVIIGDYILMIMTRQHPHYLIEIYDTVMANNLRAVFKRLWEQEKIN